MQSKIYRYFHVIWLKHSCHNQNVIMIVNSLHLQYFFSLTTRYKYASHHIIQYWLQSTLHSLLPGITQAYCCLFIYLAEHIERLVSTPYWTGTSTIWIIYHISSCRINRMASKDLCFAVTVQLHIPIKNVFAIMNENTSIYLLSILSIIY
jgi:hypothetical protein